MKIIHIVENMFFVFLGTSVTSSMSLGSSLLTFGLFLITFGTFFVFKDLANMFFVLRGFKLPVFMVFDGEVVIKGSVRILVRHILSSIQKIYK